MTPMTSLRSSCIEAMARRLHETRTPEFDIDEIPWEECHDLYRNDLRNVSMVALDALLSTLTEHEEEWMNQARNSGPFRAEVPNITGLRRALAVLRNPERSD